MYNVNPLKNYTSLQPLNQNDQELPQVFKKDIQNNNGPYNRMIRYIGNNETRSLVTPSEMVQYVKEGEALADRILNTDDNVYSEENPLKKTKAVALMWYLMARAAEMEQDYRKGSIVCADRNAYKIVDALITCEGCEEVEELGEAHDRISSHFLKIKVGPQWGIEVKEESNPLPSQMKSILFGKLKGGLIFIKMEEAGFPLSRVIKGAKILISGQAGKASPRVVRLIRQDSGTVVTHICNYVEHKFKEVQRGRGKQGGPIESRRETDTKELVEPEDVEEEASSPLLKQTVIKGGIDSPAMRSVYTTAIGAQELDLVELRHALGNAVVMYANPHKM
jgi:hypothetical protein